MADRKLDTLPEVDFAPDQAPVATQDGENLLEFSGARLLQTLDALGGQLDLEQGASTG